MSTPSKHTDEFLKVDRVAFFQAALESSALAIGEEELRILTARLAYPGETIPGLCINLVQVHRP